MPDIASPDLTLRPPRSPRQCLGGYVLLPRILDKFRAKLAGRLGEYKCGKKSMDRHFFNFTGIDCDAFEAEVATGKGDWDILSWVHDHASPPRTPWEIQAWSDYHLKRRPDSDTETLTEFAAEVAKFDGRREDIGTWFDLLDLDDHCSFGGKA